MIPENIQISAAQFDDQGKLAEYLTASFSALLSSHARTAHENGMPELDVLDELRAADDFYFSNVELMNCCLIARDAEQIVGVCCVNPFTSTLQYLAVSEPYRRQGIGSRLLGLGKKILSQRGCSHIKLEFPQELATEATLAFFQKNKLQEISRSVLLSGGIYSKE